MKSTALIAVIAATVAASGAFAQEATYDYPQPIASTMTRAQVQTELATARADGSSKVWSTTSVSYTHLPARPAPRHAASWLPGR